MRRVRRVVRRRWRRPGGREDLVELEIPREPTVASGGIAERKCRWRRAGLGGQVSLKGGLKRVVIQPIEGSSWGSQSRNTMLRPAPGNRRRHQPQAELPWQTDIDAIYPTF